MTSLDEKKRLIIDFLEKCNVYADNELEKYRNQLESARGMEALTIQDKVSHWCAYQAFNHVAIDELNSTELDHWFTDAD